MARHRADTWIPFQDSDPCGRITTANASRGAIDALDGRWTRRTALQAAVHGTPGADAAPALDLWICYIPVDAKQKINHTFGMIMVRRPSKKPWLIDAAWPAIVWFTNGIFNEDKWICELEQAAFDAHLLGGLRTRGGDIGPGGEERPLEVRDPGSGLLAQPEHWQVVQPEAETAPAPAKATTPKK